MKLKKFLCFIITLVLTLGISIPVYAETGADVTYDGNTTSYSSPADAWNKAVEIGDSKDVTFTLTSDWNAGDSGNLGSGNGFESGAMFYNGSHNLTLDLNGHTIDREVYIPKSYGEVIHVKSNMTIIDSKSDEYNSSKLYKGGTITGGSNSSRGGGIIVSDGATLNFNGGTISNCVSTDDGGAISITDSSSTLNVNGGSFYGNRTYDSSGECCGGAIYCDDAKVNIQNSVFEGNYAEDNGGAIYIDDGNLNGKDCSFYSNSSKEEGGAIFIASGASVSLEDCLFSRNESTGDDGGAIFCDSEGGTYLYNCNMYYNYSASEGGAVHINDDKVFIIGGNYQYNSANEYGGGIYVDSMDDINVAGKLVVKDNTVNGRQDDLCLQDGTSTTAYLYCGGLYEGSSIYLCSNDDNSQLAIKGIDKYQYNNYIHFDSGFKQAKVDSSSVSADGIRAEASAFSGVNVAIIIVGIIVLTAIIIFTVIFVKKKKGAKENDEK